MLAEFFRAYVAASLDPDPARIAAFYADSFLAAGPTASAAFPNDEQFLTWLRQLHDFNANAGLTSMEVVAVEESAISDAYTLATVQWGARFRPTGDERIEFKISYIVRRDDAGPKIIAYISHEDQVETMRSHGLV